MGLITMNYELFDTPYGPWIIPFWVFQGDARQGVAIDTTVTTGDDVQLYNHTVPIILSYGNLSPIPANSGDWEIQGDLGTYTIYKDSNIIRVESNVGLGLILARVRNSTRTGIFGGFYVDENNIPFNISVYIDAGTSASDILTYEPATNDAFGIYIRPGWQVSQSGSTSVLGAELIDFVQAFYREYHHVEPSGDPYAGAGDSEPVTFPHGDFDYGSDPVGGADRFHIPSVSVVDTGFVTLYNPTIQELKALSNYLWSSTFDIDTFKKIFNNPMDLFIGLSMIPVRVPQGTSKEVGIGMVGSGVYMTTASAQFVLVNCGVCDVPNFSGGYLDYSPYTKVEVYLPYIGFRTLNADEVMGKTLNVMYKVDILTGACTCWIDVLTTIADGTTDLCTTYVFMGECAVSIPLASGDWTNLLNGIIGAAAAVGAGFAAGGAGGAIAGGVSAASSVAVNDSKIHVERSGAITSSAGLMAPQSPFLIISTPHIHKPAEVPYYTGYPAYFTSVLGDLSGFTIIDKIHLSNVPATEPELEEIETLLKGGVIL